MSNILRATAGKPIDIKGGPFGGMHPDKRPSDIPESGFVYLQNVRRVGGVFTNRPGQTDFATLAGKPTGISDFPGPGDGGSKGLYYTNGNQSLLQFSLEQDPRIQKRVDNPTGLLGDLSVRIRTHRFERDSDGDVPEVSMLVTFTADSGGAKVWAISKVDPGYGLIPVDFGYQQLTYLFKLPVVSGVTYTYIYEVIQYLDRLYFAAGDAGGANFAIFSWDGRTLYLENVVVGSQPSGSALFRNSLVIGSGTNLLVKTNDTWATIATGIGAAGPDSLCFVSYHDRLWFTDQTSSSNIYSFDGASVTTYAPGTTGVTAGSKIQSMGVWGDSLYFCWYHQTAFVTDEIYVGQYDGTTWDAVWRDVFGTVAIGNINIGGLAAFNDILYLAGFKLSNALGVLIDVDALAISATFDIGDSNARNLEVQ